MKVPGGARLRGGYTPRTTSHLKECQVNSFLDKEISLVGTSREGEAPRELEKGASPLRSSENRPGGYPLFTQPTPGLRMAELSAVRGERTAGTRRGPIRH
jgi:hypothetical protein